MLRNVPRIRDVDAMLALLEDLGVARRLAQRARGGAVRRRGGRRPRSTATSPSASARRSCSPARCSPASAARVMPPPGGDVIGRRRLDPHLDAFRALGAKIDADRDIDILAPPEGLRAVRLLHGRAVGDGDRERAHGRRADAGHDRRSATPPASRTSRTSRGCSCDGRRDRRDRLQRADGPGGPSSAAASTGSRPTTSRSARSWRWPG